jgi:hypothetical protein
MLNSLDATALNALGPTAARARQEVIKTLRKDTRETAWDAIVGTVEPSEGERERVRLPYAIMRVAGPLTPSIDHRPTR